MPNMVEAIRPILRGINEKCKKSPVIIGAPPVTSYSYHNLTINEIELLRALPSFLLIPREIKESKSIVDLVTSFSVDVTDIVETLHPILIFPRTPPTVTYEIQHDLSASIFESSLNFSGTIMEIFQAFNLHEKAVTFIQDIGRMLGVDLFGTAGEPGLLKAMLGAIVGRLLGYHAMFPKIWRGCDIGHVYNLNASHNTILGINGGSVEADIKSVIGALSKFVFPRSLRQTDVEKIRQKEEELIAKAGRGRETSKEQKTVGQQVASDSRVNLLDLLYKYPYFCELVDARTGQTLIPLGFVTSATIEIDYSQTLWNGLPSHINFNLSVQPVLPLIAEIGEGVPEREKKSVMNQEVLAKIWSTTSAEKTSVFKLSFKV